MKFQTLEEIAEFLSDKDLSPLDLDVFIDETDEENTEILDEQAPVDVETPPKYATIEWGFSSVDYTVMESATLSHNADDIGMVTGEIHLNIDERMSDPATRTIDINVMTEGNTSVVRIPIQKFKDDNLLTTAVTYDGKTHPHTLKVSHVDKNEEKIVIYSPSN